MENANDDIKVLKVRIENARAQLNQMIKINKNQVMNKDIIKLSQILDDLLMEYIRRTTT